MSDEIINFFVFIDRSFTIDLYVDGDLSSPVSINRAQNFQVSI